MQDFTVNDPLALRQAAGDAAQAKRSVPDVDYDIDFALWLDRQIMMLRARRFDDLDFDNVIEELESMGKSDQRELASRLETLVMHLLKCEFQPEKKCGSWEATLLEQRAQIARLLKDSPSLRSKVAPLLGQVFSTAVRRASLETGISPSAFPTDANYTVEQVIDFDFVP